MCIVKATQEDSWGSDSTVLYPLSPKEGKEEREKDGNRPSSLLFLNQRENSSTPSLGWSEGGYEGSGRKPNMGRNRQICDNRPMAIVLYNKVVRIVIHPHIQAT